MLAPLYFHNEETLSIFKLLGADSLFLIKLAMFLDINDAPSFLALKGFSFLTSLGENSFLLFFICAYLK